MIGYRPHRRIMLVHRSFGFIKSLRIFLMLPPSTHTYMKTLAGIDAYSAAKSATVGRDSCDSGLATVASTAASLSEGVPPSEGGSETSIGGTEGESAKVGSSIRHIWCFHGSLSLSTSRNSPGNVAA